MKGNILRGGIFVRVMLCSARHLYGDELVAAGDLVTVGDVHSNVFTYPVLWEVNLSKVDVR